MATGRKKVLVALREVSEVVLATGMRAFVSSIAQSIGEVPSGNSRESCTYLGW